MYVNTDYRCVASLTRGSQAEIIKNKFGLGERGPSGIDLVLDCSGAEVCIQTGLWLVKRRGKYVQVSSVGYRIMAPLLCRAIFTPS
jgi:threonine dehydrogenase-like Zn-dependent dehydrogenase